MPDASFTSPRKSMPVLDQTADAAMSDAVALTRTFISSNPDVTPDRVVDFLERVHGALSAARQSAGRRYKPAVPVADSISPDGEFIICLVDGQPLKMLKRYIKRWDFTPETYREEFGLPPDYPMTAPGYSEMKRNEAASVGLGSGMNKAGNNVGLIMAVPERRAA